MSCFGADLATWFLDLPKREHRWGNLFMILICIALSEWMLFIYVPLLWESVNPSFPRMSRPSRFTLFASTTSISLLAASRCPELSCSWIVPAIGISMSLKHLYLVWHPVGAFHLAHLHCWRILFASALQIKLLGLPVSASQSISVLSEVVFIQISSEMLGESLCGWALWNVFRLIRLTVFQLSNNSWMKNVFSRSMLSSLVSEWVSWFWFGICCWSGVGLMLLTRRVCGCFVDLHFVGVLLVVFATLILRIGTLCYKSDFFAEVTLDFLGWAY